MKKFNCSIHFNENDYRYRGHAGLKQPRIYKFKFEWAWVKSTLSHFEKHKISESWQNVCPIEEQFCPIQNAVSHPVFRFGFQNITLHFSVISFNQTISKISNCPIIIVCWPHVVLWHQLLVISNDLGRNVISFILSVRFFSRMYFLISQTEQK